MPWRKINTLIPESNRRLSRNGLRGTVDWTSIQPDRASPKPTSGAKLAPGSIGFDGASRILASVATKEHQNEDDGLGLKQNRAKHTKNNSKGQRTQDPNEKGCDPDVLVGSQSD
jgi:hypothetical protein